MSDSALPSLQEKKEEMEKCEVWQFGKQEMVNIRKIRMMGSMQMWNKIRKWQEN